MSNPKKTRYISFNLQDEIIKRLPMKTLLRFRSVSKAWKSMIDSPDFVAAHAFRQPEPQRLLVYCKDHPTFMGNFASYADDHTFPRQVFAPAVPRSVKALLDSTIIGSSQGLLCLCGYLDPFYDINKDMVALLWNPTIGKSISIAVPDSFHDQTVLDMPYALKETALEAPYLINGTVFGFGVCPATSDPKIVKITQFTWNVEVYTLSSGKWRSLQSNVPPKSIVCKGSGSQVVIDRFIYWPAFDMIPIDGEIWNLIVSFDTTNECFGVIDLPDELALQHGHVVSIFKLRESLALFVPIMNTKKEACDVWVMMEHDHGAQITFKKLFVMKSSFHRKNLGFRENGELIVEWGCFHKDVSESKLTSLFVYKPDINYISKLGIYGENDSSFFIISYMETLLLHGRSDCDMDWGTNRTVTISPAE